MAMEEEGPSPILIVMTVIPPIMLGLTFVLTDNFSVKPSLPFFFSKILPLVLLLVATAIAVMGYFTAKDEEPEWGPELPFKVIEALHLAYIAASLILATLVILLYFL